MVILMNYNFNTCKSDLLCSNELLVNIDKTKINNFDNGYYKIIVFNNLNDKNTLRKEIMNELLFYFKKYNINRDKHILVVGIGNDNYIADSVGPRTLKHIKVNAFLAVMGHKLNVVMVSALEPGVFGETGILTGATIKSVVKEINPDMVILIDSLVTDNINYTNKCIQITDCGLSSNNGISELEFDINKKTLGVPVLLIGVATALLVKFNEDNGNRQYILTTKDVDKYVNDISLIIGQAINTSIRKIG